MTAFTQKDLEAVAPFFAAFAGHGRHGLPSADNGRITCRCGQVLYVVEHREAVPR